MVNIGRYRYIQVTAKDRWIWMLHTRPAFNFWENEVQRSFILLYFQNTLKGSVAYLLAAASSTDGWTYLPFCTSHTDGWLPCLCVVVSVFLTQKHTVACAHRWSRNSPAAARCSILSLFHTNTCSTSYLHLSSTLLLQTVSSIDFFTHPRCLRSCPLLSKSLPLTNLLVALETDHGRRAWACLGPH